jgi:hypothetical protein
MFKVSPASLQTFIDTRLTLTLSVIPNSNYVITVSNWNSLKYFCVVFFCNHQVPRDILITLYILRMSWCSRVLHSHFPDPSSLQLNDRTLKTHACKLVVIHVLHYSPHLSVFVTHYLSTVLIPIQDTSRTFGAAANWIHCKRFEIEAFLRRCWFRVTQPVRLFHTLHLIDVEHMTTYGRLRGRRLLLQAVRDQTISLCTADFHSVTTSRRSSCTTCLLYSCQKTFQIRDPAVFLCATMSPVVVADLRRET